MYTVCVWQHIPLEVGFTKPLKYLIGYRSSLLVLLGRGDKILAKPIDRVFYDTKTTKQYLKLENQGLLGTITGGSVCQV